MRILASAALAVSMISASAATAAVTVYNSSLFLGLQMRNEPIVLFITDGECKECVAADANVRSLASTRGYGRVRVLTIDTRKQKWATRGHDVQTQPTIIGFHGFKETGRVVNQSDPSKILSVFSSTLR